MRSILFVIWTLLSVLTIAQTDTLATFTKSIVKDDSVNNAYRRLTVEYFKPQSYDKDLGTLLNSLSPVYIKTYGMGGISTVSIRGGAANHSQIFWNGVSINSPTLGQMDLTLLPVEFLSSVSVSPGNTLPQLDQGGISGSVLLENKALFEKHQHLGLSKSWGSFGYDHLSMRGGYSNEQWSFQSIFLHKRTLNNFTFDDYSTYPSQPKKRENATFTQIGAQQEIAKKLKNGKLQFIAHYLNTEREVASAIGVSNNHAFQTDESYRALVSLQIDTSAQQRLKKDLKFLYGFVQDELNYRSDQLIQPSTFQTIMQDLQLHSNWHLFKRHSLNFQLNNKHVGAVSSGFEDRKEQLKSSLLLGWNTQFEKFQIHLDARQILIDVKTLPLIYGGMITYQPAAFTKLSLSANSNLHYPTLNDLYWNVGGNPNLQPEYSEQIDLKLLQNLPLQSTLSASIFYGNVDNWIQWLPNNTGIWSPENIKAVNKKGLDLLVKSNSLWQRSQSQFSFAIGYQYLDAQVVDIYQNNTSENGKRLIYIPEHALAISGGISIRSFYLQYEQKITSKVFIDAANTTYLPYTAPANLKLNYLHREGNKEQLQVFFSIKNLYNEIYQTVANQPLPGRYFEFGFSIHLHQYK